jgi:hypothetical protein
MEFPPRADESIPIDAVRDITDGAADIDILRRMMRFAGFISS